MYKRNVQRWYKHIDFILLDVLAIILSLIIAFYLRTNTFSIFSSDLYKDSMLMFVFASVLATMFLNSYHNILKRGYWEEFKNIVIHVTFVICMLLIIAFFRKGTARLSRIIIAYTYILSILFCYVFRLLWKRYIINRLRHSSSNRNVFLVTSENVAADSITQLNAYGFDFRINGIALADRDAKGETIAGQLITSNMNELIDYLVNNVVDEVFFCVERDVILPEKLIKQCQEMGITTHTNIILSSRSGDISYIEKMGGFDVITTTMKLASGRQIFVKRVLDILGGLVGCILTGLFCLYVVPKIKKADPGPAFFSQTRIGKNGREFKIYKFRSMYMDAEARKADLIEQNEMNGVMFKIENDPRILPGIGEFIRKTSIDEFPQFFNVLRGDMSLVGTRPPLPSEVDQYDLNHFQRLAVKPGITGLWQTSGRNDIKDFDEIVRLDSRYIREWNLGMDIRILLKTVMVVFKHEGAS